MTRVCASTVQGRGAGRRKEGRGERSGEGEDTDTDLAIDRELKRVSKVYHGVLSRGARGNPIGV